LYRIALFAVLGLQCLQKARHGWRGAPAHVTDMHVYEFNFETLNGSSIRLSRYRGQPILLTNTASQSRYAGQMRKLQRLWENYHRRGLVIIGVPSNDFGQREPLDEAGLELFRRDNGLAFQLTRRQTLRGEPLNPLFLSLLESHGRDKMPGWNFFKYLFDSQGHLAGFWPSQTEPDDPRITRQIEHNLCAWVL